MTEEQINHKLRHVYGCRSEDINDPRREPEQAILDELQSGPSWLDEYMFHDRDKVARYRLILSGQIERDPNGWRISKTCQESRCSVNLSAETGPTKPKE